MGLTLTTRSEFIAAVRSTLQQSLAAGSGEILCSDPDFADWPLDEPALLDALTAWARPHRRLVLLAQQYDDLQRRLPRFVRWRVTWSHVVQAYTPNELSAGDHPTLIVGGPVMLEMLDRPRWRGRVSEEGADAHRAREALDVILQRSSSAFAATTLGL